jgi:subtilase family protein/flagellar hook capping protein FlgD
MLRPMLLRALPPGLRPAALALVLASSLFPALTPALQAAIQPQQRESYGRPLLVAPATGERLVESAVRFTFAIPDGATRPMLIVSRRDFDPSGWTELPSSGDVIVHEASGPVLGLADAGIRLDSDTRLWWAVAVHEAGTGRLRVSEVRSLEALRKFANRVARSPDLLEGRIGRMPAAGLVGGQARAAGKPMIRLSAGYEFAPTEAVPAVPEELARARAAVEAGSADALEACLVQFAGSPGPAELAAIARAGGAVFSYIPDHAFLVRMTAVARARLAAEPDVAWVGDYQPAYKLSLLADRAATEPRRHMALLFPDADLRAASDRLAARGAAIERLSENGINKLVRFRAAGPALAALAALSEVAWIEPVVPLEVFNDSAQWVVQTNASGNLRVWNMGIRGQGQIVMTSDTGIRTNHDQFRDDAIPIGDFGDYPAHRKIVAYQRGSNEAGIAFGDHGTTYHGTHTAGTLMGNDDPISSSTRDGMAKDARIYFMDISGPALGNGVSPFDDLNDLFLPAYVGNAAGGARISSHSWGAPVSGAYNIKSLAVDQFMWAHPDFYVAFANGNSGPAAGTVAAPATAKSSVGAGGTQNGSSSNQIYNSTSRGPTDDNRRKPTFCSPAQSVTSASGAGNSTYQSLSGTSMGCPSGTGAVVLMRQYCTDGWYPTGAAVAAHAFSPSAALLKAMAVNAASNNMLGQVAPNNDIGWGKVSADSVLYFAGDLRKLLMVDHTDGLGHGQFIEYQVNVVDGSQPLEVTLCWTDYPGNPAAAIQLVNNLNLSVVQGATVYRGNVFVNGFSATGGSADDRNVEENVRIQAPAPGLWTVRIDAPQVPFGPQPFGLCITGGVGSGAGALALDRAEYGSTSTVELQVVDANAGPTVDVSLTSSTETTPETVTLAGTSGVYSGTLTLSPLTSGNDDGMLSVSDGDLLTATYQDAAPLATLTATAQVELSTPHISNVRTVSQGPTGTLVAWSTDRNATSRVYYGLTPALELGFAEVAGAPLQHQVLVTGLAAGAACYYDVESVGLSGGLTRDDAGGAHYRFTVDGAADVLLIYGDSFFPRAFAWQDALQANGVDYDVWSGPLAAQPVLGSTTIGLRAYAAVVWQPGFDQYPSFSDAARDTITQYLDGGGRLGFTGHDIAWSMASLASPSYTAQRAAWVQNTLKAKFLQDPPTWQTVLGVAGDPISGEFPSVPYTPIGNGAAGDEIDLVPAGGTGALNWLDNDSSPDSIGLRWASSTMLGTPGTAFWAGFPSRLVGMFFEFTALAPPHDQASVVRNGILDRTLDWLLGRERPTVSLLTLDGGDNVTTNSVNIVWSESVALGLAVGSRRLEYSVDGGGSWSLIASGVGPSPYAWNVSSVPNTVMGRVRIRITDNGTPVLGAADASAANFTINRGGGDLKGPLVLAGSIEVAPNPIVRPEAATLDARVSDQSTGGAAVTQAEWSLGDSPAAAGAGTPMEGPFGTTTVDVTVTLDTQPFATGVRKLWVRARDAAGNWGPARSLSVQVNGPPLVAVEEKLPAIAFLGQNAPNPFGTATHIRYGIPARDRVSLGIYDVQGRLVRRLVDGEIGAGVHLASWDRRDAHGTRVGAGLYYVRLVTSAARYNRRMVALD